MTGSQANRQNADIKQAMVQVARAQWQQAQTDLEYARQQLAYTALQAPVTGIIAKKSLEIGAGQVIILGGVRPVMAIVSIQDVWVEANFKETQLQHMRPGKHVVLKVDAYPGQAFTDRCQYESWNRSSLVSYPRKMPPGNFV